MTAIISRPAVDPLSPINASLAAMRRRHGEDSLQGLVPGLRASRAAWPPAATLLTADGMADFLATAARRWSAQPPAAAALAWKCYSYWLALPAVVGYAAARRVPIMTPSEVLVHYSPHQPFVRLGSARHEGVPGTGIGLGIARDLARRHGGELRVLPSERGARFEVILITEAA